MLGDIVSAIIYSNDDVDSTALRCCLAATDFVENPNACDEDVTTYDEYEYDPEGEDGMKCTQISYSQTDKIAPGLLARRVTVIEGEPVELSRSFVSDDVCCQEIQQGCGGEDSGDDEFIDGTCYEGVDNPC